MPLKVNTNGKNNDVLGQILSNNIAFVFFYFSVSLWFSGFKLEGIFVGIWVPSILGFYTVISIINNK